MKLVFPSLVIFLQVFCVNSNIYRLLDSVKPLNYDIVIRLKQNVFETNTFEGQVNITLVVLDSTQEITLHSEKLEITQFSLFHQNQTEIRDVTRQELSQSNLLRIVNSEPLSNGVYNLLIEYQGNFSFDLHGFYKSSYKNEGGNNEFLATTQFESNNARKAFPCFDEPGFKATFNLSMEYPKGYNVHSNMPQNGVNTSLSPSTEMLDFQVTPRMSTYLNAFIISKFTCDEISKNNVSFKVCSRSQASNDRKYALNITPDLLEILGNFTGIPYRSMGIDKLDQFAIPDFSANAMENWGLVTYREAALLWNANESSNSHKQRVASIIAHELSHMWFGNYVTLKWWSDVFLNEGFARYFQYFALNMKEKKWELQKQFVVDVVHSALLVDSLNNSAPLSSPVTSYEEISDKFGVISYNKGASIIRMFVHVMGLASFQAGIQHYLKTYNLSSTIPENLWKSLEMHTNLTFFKDFATSWTLQPGYPVLNVKCNGTNVIITQGDFRSAQSKYKWYIPITFTTSRDIEKFNVMAPIEWLTPNKNELILANKIVNESDWIVLNNQQTGFYRIMYDEILMNRIKQALGKNPSDFNTLNKAQIVDDIFNFARANKTSWSQVLDVTSFLSEETDYYPWFSAINGFSYLLQKINSPKIRHNLITHILKLMEKLYKSVPFSKEDFEDQIYSLKQMMTLQWACKLGNNDCVENVQRMFISYKNGTKSLSKNLRFTAYCTSLLHSKENETDWNFLWNKFRNTTVASEEVTILSALGCTSNELLLNRLMNYAIEPNSTIRMHDFNLVISAIINGHSQGAKVVFKFLIENYVYFFNDRSSYHRTLMFLSERFTDQSQIDEIETLIKNKNITGSLKDDIDEVLKASKTSIDLSYNIEEQLVQFFKKEKSAASAQKSSFIMWFLALVYIYFINKITC